MSKVLYISLLASACSLQADTSKIFEDDFENRRTGTVLQDSISSDGKAQWSFQGGDDGGVILERNGDVLVCFRQNEAADSGILSARLVSDPHSSIHVKDGVIEFDYYYLQAFNDNVSFMLNYRLETDLKNPNTGGVINGYQLRLRALNSTNPDSIMWTIQKDPDLPDPVIQTGSFYVSDLVVKGNDAPGEVVRVKLELDGESQKLSLNGSIVASFKDATSNNAYEGAFNFINNGSRARGIGQIVVSKKTK
ncbi:hypothetical protein [Cerasicoccus maritimus]|uniref:hypothetical protein n=1 Tax=Cerasicoccus maritimus TaxID=490089 RepID=UPI00285299D8|nr:hypothetical protein [Cerasicoccus maritimus]